MWVKVWRKKEEEGKEEEEVKAKWWEVRARNRPDLL